MAATRRQTRTQHNESEQELASERAVQCTYAIDGHVVKLDPLVPAQELEVTCMRTAKLSVTHVAVYDDMRRCTECK